MKKAAAMCLNQLKKPNQKQASKMSTQNSEKFRAKLYPVKEVQYLLYDGPDMISTKLRSGTPWESQTIELIQHFIFNIEKPVFIDIGANLGAISIPIGKIIQKKQGKVISFEAQRGVFYQLCGNIFSNQLIDTCTAHHIGIGNKASEIQIPVLNLAQEANIGSLSIDDDIRQQQKTLSIQPHEFKKIILKPIDSLPLPDADIIKIDVEGLELEVLQGAQKYLVRSKYPPFFFEIWGDYMTTLIPKREALIQFVHQNLGYQTTLVGELCIAQHPQNKYFDIQTSEKSLSMKRIK